MAKKNKLTTAQWDEIERKYINGVGARALSREYGAPESTIRGKFAAQSRKVKSAAIQLVAAEENMKLLPERGQILAQDLATKLRAVSYHLAEAALAGAKTSSKLSTLANLQTEYVQGVTVDKDGNAKITIDADALNTVNALSKVATESSAIGMNLLKANKDLVDRENDPETNITEQLSKIIDKLPL